VDDSSIPIAEMGRKRMLNLETQTQIRHWFYAEHWKVGTIAQQLGVHPDAVRRALQDGSSRREPALRHCLTDPYVEFVRTTLERYPRLRATRIFQMVRDRGYPGSVVQLRRLVARLRPVRREAFLRLAPFPGQEAQADWAHFGEVQVGRACRRQIELLFKRLKSILAMGHLPKYDDQSSRAWLYGKLLVALLTQKLVRLGSAISPWGYDIWPTANTQSVA
jgi:hypothetical protein